MLPIVLACFTVFGDREGLHRPLQVFRDVKKPQYSIFGHVHVAKTGGTSLNGMLANQFERVCGHKGYSYDFFQSNRRHKTAGVGEANDFIHKHYRRRDRQRVVHALMDEIGFEDCEWISLEKPWTNWGPRHGVTELHVPCRNPVDHLLSQCNHMGKSLDRRSHANLRKSANECLLAMDRFSNQLLAKYRVKCFSFENQFNFTKGYLHWISQRLQLKRFYEKYNMLSTNGKRKPVRLSNVEKNILTTELMRYDYYQFCNRCMKSSDVLE